MVMPLLDYDAQLTVVAALPRTTAPQPSAVEGLSTSALSRHCPQEHPARLTDPAPAGGKHSRRQRGVRCCHCSEEAMCLLGGHSLEEDRDRYTFEKAVQKKVKSQDAYRVSTKALEYKRERGCSEDSMKSEA